LPFPNLSKLTQTIFNNNQRLERGRKAFRLPQKSQVRGHHEGHSAAEPQPKRRMAAKNAKGAKYIGSRTRGGIETRPLRFLLLVSLVVHELVEVCTSVGHSVNH
jgi:hypothetical protein